MPVIINNGIYLPNGLFVPNRGDGHAKNADRICDSFDELKRMKNASYQNSDDFLISAGCCIVAVYRGERCFKIASDNVCSVMVNIKHRYEQEGIKIWSYWNIDTVSHELMKSVVGGMPKMEIVRVY